MAAPASPTPQRVHIYTDETLMMFSWMEQITGRLQGAITDLDAVILRGSSPGPSLSLLNAAEVVELRQAQQLIGKALTSSRRRLLR